jgi:hypothetical protein
MNEAEWLECTDPRPMLQFLHGKASSRKLRLFASACCYGLLPRARLWSVRSWYPRLIHLNYQLADGRATARLLALGLQILTRRQRQYRSRLDHLRRQLETAREDERGAREIADAAQARYEAAAEPHASVEEWAGAETARERTEQRAYEAVTRFDQIEERLTTWRVRRNLADLICHALNGRYDELSQVMEGAIPGIRRAARQFQCDSLRCMFNPFRPVSTNSQWLAWRYGTVPNMAEAFYNRPPTANLPMLADALEEAGCERREILEHCRGRRPRCHLRGCWVLDLLLGRC